VASTCLGDQNEAMAADSFGIPDGMLGKHPEEFYGAVGRIVTLSALLENGLQALVEKLKPTSQGSLGKKSATDLVAEGRRHLPRFDDAAQRARAERFFADIDGALKERNDVAHDLWPAQPGGDLLGHRPSRQKVIGADRTQIKSTDMDAFRSLIKTLVRLIQDCPAIGGGHLTITG
jgi:hypothetical protein